MAARRKTRGRKEVEAAERGGGGLPVLKTWKLYIAGAFPRSESGRTLPVRSRRGGVLGHVCQASRKDLREAVVAARGALAGWSGRDAANRGLVLYRMAEMLEGRREEFAALLAEMVPGGLRRARREVAAACDRVVAFAGWADKYTQVLGCANPVAGPYHDFTIPEPVGVVGVVAPDEEPLLALLSLLLPPLTAGCTVVALGSEAHPLATALLGEICATCDLPPGSVNLLTGVRSELVPVLAIHRDVDAVHAASSDPVLRRELELGAAENLKRVRVREAGELDWYDPVACHSPWWIEPFVEMKTLWHPSAP